MTIFKDYIRAHSTTEVVELLQKTQPACVLAGGTDLLLDVQEKDRGFTIIDIGDVAELAAIETKENGIRIGAAAKLTDIARSDLMTGALECLVQGASQVGSIQIRNLASLGGNLCNAAPSADTAAPLLVLDAQVEIVSSIGRRTIPLSDFFLAPGETALDQGELLEAVFIPSPPPGAVSLYLKHAFRKAMDLAIVGVAVLLSHDGEYFDARIGLAAVAPTPIRATKAEELIAGAKDLDHSVIEAAAQIAEKQAAPISDVRASARYRSTMIRTLTGRALQQTFEQLH